MIPSLLKGTDFQSRYEQYGGILSSEEPPFLAHVDRDFMRELGFAESPLWVGEEQDSAPLSAPLEVHFSITNRCKAGCHHCYTGATPEVRDELSFEQICQTVDELAAMGVFHIALGGGEALEREDLFDVAAYARERGIIPNLTTSGYGITVENIEQCSIFGQVNISIDSLKNHSENLRKGSVERRLAALKLLKKAKIRCGINCVLTRETYEELPELIRMARKLKLREIELLRLKPSGRAANDLYYNHRLSDEQHRNLLPTLKRLYKKYGVHLKIDCSFVPMVMWHRPDKELLERLSLYGCEAGAVLLGINPQGEVAGCSFLKGESQHTDLGSFLQRSEHISHCKEWSNSAPAPCNQCHYIKLCKGGCRAVSLYCEESFSAPDPECPYVIQWKESLCE